MTTSVKGDQVVFDEVSAPSTPASAKVTIYAKADGLMYSKDDAGTETLMSGGAPGMSSFNLAGDSGTPQAITNGNTVTIAGGTGIDTVAGATDTVTVAIDSTVATLTGSQTLTNKTLTAPIISGGTADNMAIGTTTRALGYFSALRLYIAGFAAIFTHAFSDDRTVTLPGDADVTLVGVATAQTLTNKTLTTPTVGDLTNAQHNHTNAAGGGQITDAALSAAVGISKGGTGQTTATAAFDALAPTTTTGDISYYNGTDNVRLPIGSTNEVLTVIAGVPSWEPSAGGSSVADFCDFRLSLSSGVPIMTSNVTAATTVYAVPINLPYTEGLVTLKNGSTWETIFTGEASVALTGATASRPYDVFGYYDTGAMLIEILAWTNATTRATAIDVEDGHPIKAGDATRRFLGTIRITGTTGQCEFSPVPSAAPSKLFVWNLMHQVAMTFRVIDTTNSWSYATSAWRQANGSGNNQIEVITGAVKSAIVISLDVLASAVNPSTAAIAIGEDSTTARATENVGMIVSSVQILHHASFNKIVPLGYHYYSWLEYGDGTAVTWYGDNNTPDTAQSGFTGTFFC
jgi:hypothetical protein